MNREGEGKIKIEAKRRVQHSPFDFYPESYAALSREYWFTLFVSGFLIMWVSEYLGWRTGIAWFFISNFISMILVRIDMTANANVVLSYERKNSQFLSLLN